MFDFSIDVLPEGASMFVNGNCFYYEHNGGLGGSEQINELAMNDGLELSDFFNWFKWPNVPFVGQVICWSDDIKYE